MSEKISGYADDATSKPIQAQDLLDFSNYDGGTYDVSKKISVSEFLNYLNLNIDNIYNQDGTLTGSRTLELDGNTMNFIDSGVGGVFNVDVEDEIGLLAGGSIDFETTDGPMSLTSDLILGINSQSDKVVIGGALGVLIHGQVTIQGEGTTPTTSSLLIKNDSSVAMFESRDDGSLIYGNNVSGAIDYIHTFKGDATVGNSGRLMQITDEANNIDYYNFQAGSFRIESIAAAAGGWTNNMSRIVMDTGGTNDMVQLVAAFDGTHNLTIQNSSSPSQLNTVSSFSIITNNVTNYFCGDARHALQDGARLKIGGNGNHTGLFSTDSKVVIDGGSYQNALSVLSGRFGVGTETATAQAHIDQASTSGAIPVLNLDQADLSEQFIDFIATEAAGNPIEDVGAKTLTTTKFIRISVNGSKLYIPAGTIA